jgi:lipid II:glycine glycyltransferase (peptidoglycan interpeptide bridge formation enzyme)
MLNEQYYRNRETSFEIMICELSLITIDIAERGRNVKDKLRLQKLRNYFEIMMCELSLIAVGAYHLDHGL